MRISLFLIISLVFCGTVVCSQDLNPKNRGNGNTSDNKESRHRFSLFNSGINGIFDTSLPAASEDSELKQFSSDTSFLIQEENEFIEGLEQEHKAKSTIIWGGIFPFVSLPNEDVENREGFFSNDSIFFFWYLKKKF
jgi:hypothetical protein